MRYVEPNGAIIEFSDTHIKEAKKSGYCPRCGRVMQTQDEFRVYFSGGEYSQSGGEYLYCNCCKVRIDL